ncbi:MAG: tRNA lysidine(34) synthetase TilS [Candidatus Gracilibacteria bacterium]|nr:tRNA lysidine(34) synthetase TilS [Candidatus Gracilibacteria bacterium]
MMIEEFLKKYDILESGKIIIACSGGSDSIYLLSEILKYKKNEDIIVCHFNHNLRAEESTRDEKFVSDFCAENQLKYEIGESDIKKISESLKIGIEETARIKRYEFLREMKVKYDSKYILTAHHLDDKIETFMLNLIRGTKLKGLISIEEKNDDLLRPLLHISKKDILKHLNDCKIPFIEDSSNSDDNYLRNHIRLNITPLFEKINPNYRSSFDSIMEYFGELKNSFDDQIRAIIDGKDYFEISEFEILSLFMKKELIRYVFEKTNNGTIGLTRSNIDEVIRFIGDKGNHTKKEIKQMKLLKKNGKVYFMD